MSALAAEMSSGELEGLEMWRTFHTDDFDAEEVEFDFQLPAE